MSERLPDTVQYHDFVEQARVVRGEVPVALLERLAAITVKTDDRLEAEFAFGQDASGQAFLRGRIAGTLKMQCQRCLEAMDYPVALTVSLALVRTEEDGERLPAEYEPLLVSGPTLSLYGVLEDEIILALPIVAMHEGDNCPVEANYSTVPEEERTDSEQEGDNPFAVLASLKGKKSTTH